MGPLSVYDKTVNKLIVKPINLFCRYGEMMTVYFGARQAVYLNTHDVIKEAFVKHGHSFAGRPQDLFYMTELCDSMGTYWSFVYNERPILCDSPKAHKILLKSALKCATLFMELCFSLKSIALSHCAFH